MNNANASGAPRTGAAPASKNRSPMPVGLRRIVIVGILFGIFAVSSLLAFLQVHAYQNSNDRPIVSLGWWIRPIGYHPPLPLVPDFPNLSNIIAVPDTNIWWALDGGNIVKSEDGGQHWKTITIPPPPKPPAAGKSAALLMNRDRIFVEAKLDPRLDRSDISKIPYSSICFLTADRGFAGGDYGTVIVTEDGGSTWRRAFSGQTDEAINFVYVAGDCGIVCSATTYWITRDGGHSWGPQYKLPNRVYGACVVTRNSMPEIWAVGEKGFVSILFPADQTIRIEPASSAADDDRLITYHAISSVQANDTLMVVGDSGAMARLQTTDHGATWKKYPLPKVTDFNLNSIIFTDAQQGYACSDHGAVVATQDGGLTWRQTKVSTYPAPWYWALCVLFLIISVGFLVQRETPVPAENKYITDSMASDKPLEPGDRDPLNLNTAALRVSLFLLNDNTPPPLTIAVTGKWGAGKSSLMNLIRGQLRQRWLRPVWFNAWHAQTEEHLLANLLEAVRSQAFPSPLSIEGVRLRYRLLRHRMGTARYQRIALLSTAFLAMFCGYAVARYEALRPKFSDFAGFLDDLNSRVQHFSEPSALQKIEVIGTLGGIVVSLATLLRTFTHALQGFHVKPGSLLATSSGSTSLKQLSDMTSFRYRFAREFKDVTDTLNPDRTLLIMIDDLDRCKPEAVIRTLEAINFLVTSGDCFILVAMDRVIVETAIAAAYKTLSLEMSSSGGIPGRAGQPPTDFASKYLEKLFNFEVPVPSVDDKDVVNLLLPPVQKRAEPESRPRRAWRATRSILTQTPVLIGFVFITGFLISFVVSPTLFTALPTTNASTQPDIVAAAGPVESQPATALSSTVPRNVGPASAPAPPAQFTHAVASHPPWILAGAVGAGFIILAAVIVTKRPKLAVTDSDLFRDVLDLWQPIICVKPYTPRSLKQFLNKIRYFAMGQRDPVKASQSLDASIPLRSFLKGEAASITVENVPGAMPEPALIALSTLFYVFSNQLQDPKGWPALLRGDYTAIFVDIPDDLAKTIRNILDIHVKRWGNPFSQENLLRMKLLAQQFH